MWEDIKGSRSNRLFSDRLKVPGGWIVRSIILSTGVDGGSSLHQVFIVDPDHEWELDN